MVRQTVFGLWSGHMHPKASGHIRKLFQGLIFISDDVKLNVWLLYQSFAHVLSVVLCQHRIIDLLLYCISLFCWQVLR